MRCDENLQVCIWDLEVLEALGIFLHTRANTELAHLTRIQDDRFRSNGLQ